MPGAERRCWWRVSTEPPAAGAAQANTVQARRRGTGPSPVPFQDLRTSAADADPSAPTSGSPGIASWFLKELE